MENLINTLLKSKNKIELDRLSKLEFTDIMQLLLINPNLPMRTLLKMCTDKDCDKSFYAMERFEKLEQDILIEYYKLVQDYIRKEIENQIEQYSNECIQLRSFIVENIDECENFKSSVEGDIFNNYVKNRIIFDENNITLIDEFDDRDDGLFEIVKLQSKWMFDCFLKNSYKKFDVLKYLLDKQYIKVSLSLSISA